MPEHAYLRHKKKDMSRSKALEPRSFRPDQTVSSLKASLYSSERLFHPSGGGCDSVAEDGRQWRRHQLPDRLRGRELVRQDVVSTYV